MNRETKERLCKFIVRLILGDDFGFTIVRRKYLEEVARKVSRYPQSKITALRILRLDGSSLKDAMEIYNRFQDGK